MLNRLNFLIDPCASFTLLPINRKSARIAVRIKKLNATAIRPNDSKQSSFSNITDPNIQLPPIYSARHTEARRF